MTEREKWIRLCNECYAQGAMDALERESVNGGGDE